TQIIGQPFYADIQAFKKQDSTAIPPPNQILFVGSSSFTNWKDVQNYFPSYPIINRGFGGSSLTDVIFYAEDVIFRYQPKQIVIYCGENDIAGADSVTGQMVFERFKTLFHIVRQRLPQVPIVYISMKPSPSRWHMKERVIDGNDRIKKFLKKQKRTKFVSVWKAMLGADGQPRKDLFVADMLHMNALGYAIWKEKIEKHLMK
ncbi:MAG: GDSL-type esterase/lipase family protein, partial [Bacteroidota bacterium]